MALGGYNGTDNILTRDQLIHQIDSGTVRFFLLPSFEPDPNFPSWAQESVREGLRVAIVQSLPEEMGWVITHCGEVPTNQWQTPSQARLTDTNKLQLYDCAHHT
jgi:hypothetical protein